MFIQQEFDQKRYDTHKPFEQYLPMLPDVVKVTYDELNEKLHFVDGIEKYVDEGEGVLKRKHFPKTGDPSESFYSWLCGEIVKVLETHIIGQVPERILITAAFIMFHAYDLYGGESGQDKIENRNIGHVSDLKTAVVYLLQLKNHEFMGTDHRKYWTLFNLLKESQMIQPVVNLSYDRRVAEGLLYFHHIKFNFSQRKWPYLSKPNNLFLATNHFTPEENSQAALWQIKQLVCDSKHSLIEQPFVWQLKQELLNEIELKIATVTPEKYEPEIHSNKFKATQGKLLHLKGADQEKVKDVLIMLISSLQMNLSCKLEFYENNDKYTEFLEGKMTAGRTFGSYEEFQKCWCAEIRPYLYSYKLKPTTHSSITANYSVSDYSETPGGETYAERYKYFIEERQCKYPSCPWKLTLKLKHNETELMKSCLLLEAWA